MEPLPQRTETAFGEGIRAATKNQTAPTEQTSSHGHEDEKGKKNHLKVTDTATSEIVAYAVWIFLPNGYGPGNELNANLMPLSEGGRIALSGVVCAS